MKILLSLILLSSPALVCSASGEADWLQSFRINYRLDSFVGSEYYPEKSYHDFVYCDKLILGIRGDLHLNTRTDFWLELRHDNVMFDKEIIIYRTGVSQHCSDFVFSYKLDRLEFGKGSEIFQKNINNVFFDRAVLTEYRFDGAECAYQTGNFCLNVNIGGNSYNTSIVNGNISHHDQLHEYRIFYLYVSRSSEFNEKTHITGAEFNQKIKNLDFYDALIYQYVPSLELKEFRNLTELNLKLSPTWRAGTNFLYTDYSNIKNRNWQITSYLSLKYKLFSQTLLFRYHDMNEFSADYIDREYNFIAQLNFHNLFSVGANLSYFFSSYDEFYLLGIQANASFQID
ncbi:MAG: hypothetical protein JXB60_04440 [Candidatus Cloacimonetes bacterium]|nr:hypothetical protein [Candidatus Cloacimonadota bacterium]